jgi:hypothetical protein
MPTGRRYRLLSISAAIAGLLAVSGCGSGGSGEEAPTALTKAQFLSKGDQICKKRVKEKDEALQVGLERFSKEGNQPSKQSREELAESALPMIRQISSELSELPPPAKDSAEVEAMISKFEAGVKQAEANPLILTETDPMKPAADAARAYGFKACNV